MLNEDSYTPFPYFYDVTAWSLPLLGNVSGGSSGAVLHPRAVRVPTLPAPRPGHERKAPKLGVLQLSATSSSARESTGWLRHRLDREWKLPFTLLTPADVAAGKLSGIEVLVTPDGPASSAYTALGDAGRAALQDWTRGGGRYVGWQGGAQLAARLGLTTATLAEPTSDIPGSLFRVRVDESSPLAKGVGATAWNFTAYDLVMTASSGVAVSYPQVDSPDWFVSGFGGARPSWAAPRRSWTSPSARDVPCCSRRNRTSGRSPTARPSCSPTRSSVPPRRAPAPQGTAKAAQEAAELPSYESPIRVSVQAEDAAKAAAVLRSAYAEWAENRSGGVVHYVIDNPRGLPVDHHPFAGRLPSLIRVLGIVPVAVTLP